MIILGDSAIGKSLFDLGLPLRGLLYWHIYTYLPPLIVHI